MGLFDSPKLKLSKRKFRKALNEQDNVQNKVESVNADLNVISEARKITFKNLQNAKRQLKSSKNLIGDSNAKKEVQIAQQKDQILLNDSDKIRKQLNRLLQELDKASKRVQIAGAKVQVIENRIESDRAISSTKTKTKKRKVGRVLKRGVKATGRVTARSAKTSARGAKKVNKGASKIGATKVVSEGLKIGSDLFLGTVFSGNKSSSNKKLNFKKKTKRKVSKRATPRKPSNRKSKKQRSVTITFNE